MDTTQQRYTVKRILQHYSRPAAKPYAAADFVAAFHLADMDVHHRAIVNGAIVLCKDGFVRPRISAHHCADVIKFHCL